MIVNTTASSGFRCEWVSLDEAVRRCRPSQVARGIELAGRVILGPGEGDP